MSSQQFIIRTTDASIPNGGDILVTVYGGSGQLHLTAACRNALRPSAWEPPLPVHALDGCEGCGHRGSDHDGGCTLCDCAKVGGVR